MLALSVKRPDGDTLPGRWYYHERPLIAPPRDLDAFHDALTAGQQTNFDRRLKEVRASGDPQVVALLWGTEHGTNGLVLHLSRDDAGDVHAQSLEFAPSDTTTLMLRCGPDVELLKRSHVTVFGAGSVGSNLVRRLADAGLGTVRIIDGDTMRPGNIVRHASVLSVGANKALATAASVTMSAPWTKTEEVQESPWAPARVAELMQESDLVIDATGLSRFTNLISRIAEQQQQPLISAALYRGGAVARVRRQMPRLDVAIPERIDKAGYPLIPPGDEPVALEPGCNATVNNASPIAVAAIAALSAEIAVDLLAGRLLYPEETLAELERRPHLGPI